MKKCNKCGIELILNVNITPTQLNIKDYKCKECRKLNASQHYKNNTEQHKNAVLLWKKNNPDLDKKMRSDYYLNNKDKHKSWAKDWIENNYERHKEYKKEWQKNLLKDPLNKLKSTLRKHIHNGSKFGNKNNTSLEVVGMTSWEEFKLYIESQFEEGMNWSNHGKGTNNSTWHIDHIIPISSTKTLDEVKKLNHYSNLRPMWGSDNIRKSNKMLGD